MTVYQLDPLRDPRWGEFLQRQPRASVFHTPGWLEALRRTYGYEPVVLTTSPPGAELTNGLTFCQIESWLTGRRLVSLPFSDHCEPLVDNLQDLNYLLGWLERELEKEKWKYIEIRPLAFNLSSLQKDIRFQVSRTFCLHRLDLGPDIDQLFLNLHKSSSQKKIQRAERQRLAYEEGRSESIIAKFYHLLLLTRRRHQLPPQPINWFYNLAGSLGDKVKIRIATKDGRPAAGILTFCYKNTVVYKYGCSDANLHNLGGVPFLLWKTIQEAKANALREFDLGRSDCDNSGLIAFKDHWGASRSMLAYYRCPAGQLAITNGGQGKQITKRIIGYLPDSLLTIVGKLMYKHFG